MIDLFKKYFSFLDIAFYIALILVFTSCDKEVSRSPVEPEVPKGFIYVNSVPKGFTIFRDGRNTGRITPDSISYIEAGHYKITLKKKYFKDTSLVVNLNLNEKLILNVDFISNPSMYGSLYLQTIPTGASITLNDSTLNKVTPLSLQNLLPGEYRIKFKLFNYRDGDIIAIVQSNKNNNYSAELRDTSEWVDYQVFNSGIQSNALSAIAVDNNNIKWIGTLDKGLIKYDEVDLVNYNTANSSIPFDRINCISIDPQNRVWVGTDFGFGIFDGVGWTVYNRNNSGLTSEIINDFAFDNNGNAWIGTSANLVKFDGVSWTLYEEPNARDWINAINIQSETNIWLGTTLNGIYRFENGNYISYPQTDYGYPSKTISSIDSDEFNYIWFCFLPDTSGRGGISYWDGNVFNNYLFDSPQIYVNQIFIDDVNNKWFATSDGLLSYNNQNLSKFYNTSNSLISSNNVSASAVDLNGNVWITTGGCGLNKYKPPR